MQARRHAVTLGNGNIIRVSMKRIRSLAPARQVLSRQGTEDEAPPGSWFLGHFWGQTALSCPLCRPTLLRTLRLRTCLRLEKLGKRTTPLSTGEG